MRDLEHEARAARLQGFAHLTGHGSKRIGPHLIRSIVPAAATGTYPANQVRAVPMADLAVHFIGEAEQLQNRGHATTLGVEPVKNAVMLLGHKSLGDLWYGTHDSRTVIGD